MGKVQRAPKQGIKSWDTLMVGDLILLQWTPTNTKMIIDVAASKALMSKNLEEA